MARSAQEQEGLGLEYLDKLTLFDDFFEYDGKNYDFKNIEHVEFTAVATKTSVNFVPAGTRYSANLFLHLSDGRRLLINQERVFLNRKEKERSEAVMRAAGIFMDITFNRRIEAYERQMKEKGFVSWGRQARLRRLIWTRRRGGVYRRRRLARRWTWSRGGRPGSRQHSSAVGRGAGRHDRCLLSCGFRLLDP